MTLFEFGELSTAITGLSNFAHGHGFGGSIVIPEENHRDQIRQINIVCSEIEKLGFAATLVSAQELKKIIEEEVTNLPPSMFDRAEKELGSHKNLRMYSPFVGQRYQNYAKDLVSRFKDEAKEQRAFFLNPNAIQFYDLSQNFFGDSVASAFPEAMFDIGEGGKCLALGRYTAVVFHMMRAVESGVASLAASIGAQETNKYGETLAWGVLLSNIKGKIDELPKGEDQDKWHEAHALLHSVNRAWRTKTAHPKSKYSKEDAEMVFSSSKAFLKFMAKRIS